MNFLSDALHTVPLFIITPRNITVPENVPEVEVCVSTETSLSRDVVVTAQTGRKVDAPYQATGNR